MLWISAVILSDASSQYTLKGVGTGYIPLLPGDASDAAALMGPAYGADTAVAGLQRAARVFNNTIGGASATSNGKTTIYLGLEAQPSACSTYTDNAQQKKVGGIPICAAPVTPGGAVQLAAAVLNYYYVQYCKVAIPDSSWQQDLATLMTDSQNSSQVQAVLERLGVK